MKKANLRDDENIKAMAKVVDTLPDDVKPFARELYNEILFMQRSLKALKEDIDKNGVNIQYTGSTGSKLCKTNPSLQSYNALIKNYSSVIRHLEQLFGDELTVNENDELLDFIKR